MNSNEFSVVPLEVIHPIDLLDRAYALADQGEPTA